MIREVQDRHPDVIFLAEAFTRPKMMKRLAKVGFTQSYTLLHLAQHQGRADRVPDRADPGRGQGVHAAELLRQHARHQPGVPADQRSGRLPDPRLVLAATLSTVYGIYNGFELCEGTPIPGREEYLDSEKYEIKAWD